MRRVLQFSQTESNYVCLEDNNIIFEISKTDLQFNVKNFYSAFYAEDKAHEEIVIENTISSDSKATRIYNSIITLVGKIKAKLDEDVIKEDEDIDEFLEE